MVKQNEQNFYYQDIGGRLLGNKAREKLILQEMKKIKGKDFFLEVGCAQGHFEKLASSQTKNVFGGEYEFEFLQRAKKKCPKCGFVNLNAESLPFKGNAFDFVLCTEVLEHVPNWENALKELQRVSRKKVMITVPLEKGVFWRTFSKFKGMETRGHLHRLDSTTLVGELEKGWKVARYELITTPSRHLNKLIGNRLGEKLSMYAMLLLEKN